MKKIACIITLLTSIWGTYAQETVHPKKFEVKLNTTNLLLFNFLEVSGEYLLSEESSIGISLLTSIHSPTIEKDEDLLLFDRRRSFSITPYFRQYLSKSYAKGFFFEAFGMLNSGTEYEFEDNLEILNPLLNKTKYTNFAFGLSIGGKWVSKKGFTAEIYMGLGRNLINNDAFSTIITRGGVGLGYRF